MTDSWEQRMSQRAHARMYAARAARRAEEEAPHLPEAHRGHHTHLRGAMMECSCGEHLGVTCVAFSEDFPPDQWVCEACGARGVLSNTPPTSSSAVNWWPPDNEGR